jgi:uracil-DNA glycosylase
MSWDERQRAMLAAMGLRVWGEQPAAMLLAESAVAVRAVAAAPLGALVSPVKVAQAVPPLPVSVLAALPTALRQAHASPSPAAPATSTTPVAAPLSQSMRAQSIAAMDWPELQHSVEDCRACPLCEARKHPVFGAGLQRADWMVVGELPGEEEELAGTPFAGQSGLLLNNMLRALGLAQVESAIQTNPGTGADADPSSDPARSVYIANALKCRPPPSRSPVLDDVQQCAPYLQRQIELVQPRVILALGRWAIQALLNSGEPVGRLRGQVHEYRGIPVIVSYLPSYLLRNLAHKALAWDDLCLALQTLQSRGRA